MIEPKYKAGDSVKVNIIFDELGNKCQGERSKYNGESGIIVEHFDQEEYSRVNYAYSIRFDNDDLNDYEYAGAFVVFENEFIKKIKATKLAKKMYPNRIEEDGWLL